VAGGFDTTFQFRITEPGSPRGYTYGGRPQSGGDGLAFLIQNSSASAVSESGGGGNLGYGGYEGSSGGIPNSLAVEFDTFYNPEYHDPNDSHLSVHTRGAAPNSSDEKCSIGAARTSNLSDGKVHTARVVYVPGQLRIYLDHPEKPVLTVHADLARLLRLPEGLAWVGFTGSEGGAYENHDLLSWTFASTGSAPKTAPPELKPTVTLRPRTPSPAAGPSGSSTTGDDWLRPRRDAANTARSSQPIRIPLQQSWTAELAAVDARIRGNTAMVLDDTGSVTALDLSTGREQWRHPGVEVLGDASEDGQLTLLTRDENTGPPGTGSAGIARSLTVLKMANGETVWSRPAPNAIGPVAVHEGIVYLCTVHVPDDGTVEMHRYHLADGSVLPTTTAPLDGWSLPAFTDSQILFGGLHWLYALYLPDPQRGTKFYDGGLDPLLSGEEVGTVNWVWGIRRFRRDGKWLRPIYGSFGQWGTLRYFDMPPYYAALVNPYPPIHESEGEEANALLQRERILLNVAIPRVVASSGLLIQEEEETESGDIAAGFGSSTGRVLTARDLETQAVLWRSEEYAGRPLAVAHGSVLIASGPLLRCLR
jgi:hypothetical protein